MVIDNNGLFIEELQGSVPLNMIKLFAVFARFEFALIATGYVGGDNGDYVYATWDDFASDLHKSFFPKVQHSQRAAILFNEPPRTLVKFDGNNCRFIDGNPPTNAQSVLLAVRIIRNNLFHGSKSNPRERDMHLVDAANEVLTTALDIARLELLTNRVSVAWGYCGHIGEP